MIRVLQIVGSLGVGGIETFLMNVYRRIDRTKIQFDFLLTKPDLQYHEPEVLQLGGKVYRVPSRKQGLGESRKALRRFFRERDEFSVVHYHVSSLTNIDPLIAAERAGIPKRIIHSHNTREGGSKLGVKIHTALHYLHTPRIASAATDYLACGEAAADWLYKEKRIRKKAVVLMNGIDVKRFAFNAAVREQVRKELQIASDAIVYGHVGRFHEQKNHIFLVSVFNELKKRRPNSILWLIGDGDLKSSVETKVAELGLTDDVVFWGNRSDVDRLLQAMDAMIFPSLYEGFPIVLAEAQASGAPCFLSDGVTRETMINDNVRMIGLKRSAAEWAEEITREEFKRCDSRAVVDVGFDIQTTVDYLTKLYS